MTTLNDILLNISSHLDLETTLPSDTELTYRIDMVDQALQDWASIYDWRQLKQEFYPSYSSGITVALPDNFRNFTTAPRVYRQGAWYDYPEVLPEEKFEQEELDRYCYVLGDSGVGYNAIFNNLDSGASISIIYQRYPSSMASPSDLCEVPDPQYLVYKAVAYVLMGRSDARFQVVDAMAEQKLSNMIGREQKQRPGGRNYTRRTGAAAWRIGE